MTAPAAAQPIEPPGPARHPRLNPFSFPSNTDFFFALLVFAVLAVTLQIYSMFFLWNHATGIQYVTQTGQCLDQFGVKNFSAGTAEFTNLNRAYISCITPIERLRAAWMLAGVLPELALAGLIYWFYPAWIIRRGRLTPLTGADFPELAAAVAGLGAEIGLERLPDLYWDPLDLTAGGMAFGRMGRYAVKLTGGLVSQFYTDPNAFKAVMLHELSHIRSADIDKTYLTMGLWTAFLAGTLIPLIFFLFGSDLGLLADLAWRIALLGLLVFLIRNEVLRSREYYADLRAYRFRSTRDSLKQILAGLRPPRARLPLGARTPFRRADALLAVHPQPAQRLAVLDSPLPLFKQGFLTALATGLVVGIGYEPLMGFLSATNLLDITVMAFLTGFVAGPLVAALVGLGVWRSVFARLFEPDFPLHLGRLAAGLALGMYLGWQVSPVRLFVTHTAGNSLPVVLGNVGVGALWVLVLALSLVYFLRWMAYGAGSWLRAALERPSPRPYWLAGVGVAALVLSTWLGLTFFMLYLMEDPAVSLLIIPVVGAGALFTAVSSPVTLLVLAILWAFPLAAGRLGGRLPGGQWAFLDAAAESIPVTALRQAPLGLRGVILPAVGLAGVYSGLVVLIRLGLRLVMSEAARSQDATKLYLVIGFTLLAVCFQILAAVWVTARSRENRAFRGLLAAFTAGALMAAGFLAGNLLLGGSIDAQFALDIFCYFINAGGLAALPFIVLVNWLMKSGRPDPRVQISPVTGA